MSYREAFCSLFTLHNETMNVWTHLLGALLFAWHLASLCAALSAASSSSTVLGLASPPAAWQQPSGHPVLYLRGGVHSKQLAQFATGPAVSAACYGGSQPPPAGPLAPPDTPFHVAAHWVEQASKSVAQAEAQLLLHLAASGAHTASAWREQATQAVTHSPHSPHSRPLLTATHRHMHAFKQQLAHLSSTVQHSAELTQVQLFQAREHLAAAVAELQVEAAQGSQNAQQHMADAVASVAAQWNVLMHRAGMDHLSFDVEAQAVRHPHAVAMMIIATSAAITMGVSAVFHLLFVVGRPEASVLNRLDYAGIVVLIAGSTFATVYFFFYCRPLPYWIYICLATAMNVYVGVMAQTDVFGSTAYDLLRPAAFTAAGVLSAVPVLHALFLPELRHLPAFWNMLRNILIQGGFYLVGVSLYAAKFPERYAPGWCDVFLGSHQLFHVCVAAAAWMLYTGAQHMEEYLEAHPNFCLALEV